MRKPRKSKQEPLPGAPAQSTPPEAPPALPPPPTVITPQRPQCTHSGATAIIKFGQTVLFAGSAVQIGRMAYDKGLDALISVGGHTQMGNARDEAIGVIDFTPEAAAMFPKATSAEGHKSPPKALFVIDWPDMGIPPVGLAFWEALVNDFFEGPPRRIGMFCAGGHGRTGTALSIIAHLSNVTKGKDPVAWVRKKYCEKAVESDSQFKYLREVIGIETEEGASKDFFGAGTVPFVYGRADDDVWWAQYEKDRVQDTKDDKGIGILPPPSTPTEKTGLCIACSNDGTYAEEAQAYLCSTHRAMFITGGSILD